METIAFIGVGTMGKRISARLLQAGYAVRAYDILPQALEAVAALGAAACQSPEDACRGSDVIITSLPDSPVIERVVFGEGGILAGCRPGQIFIEMSSASPASTRKIAEELEKKGVHMLDAPVSGGPIGAERGTLSILVGGDPGVLAQVRPILQIIGDKDKIIHAGGHGAGHVAKAVNNLLFGTTMIATCQALALGVKAGIPTDTLVKVFQSSSGASYSVQKLVNYALAGQVNPGFTMKLLAKDMGIALDLAAEEAVTVDVCQKSREYFLSGIRRGWENFDNSKILTLFEEAGGTCVHL